MKCFSLTSSSQNLCSLCSVSLLSLETKPVLEPTSNGRTDTVCVFISDSRCWYFSNLSLLDSFIRPSPGTVSSKTVRVFFLVSSITIFGLKVETIMFGGRVPPARGAYCSTRFDSIPPPPLFFALIFFPSSTRLYHRIHSLSNTLPVIYFHF